jgi:hypothetical protein
MTSTTHSSDVVLRGTDSTRMYVRTSRAFTLKVLELEVSRLGPRK